VPDPLPELPADPRISVLVVLAQSTGGIGRHVLTTAAGLTERGVDVTICAPEQSIAGLGLDTVGVPVVPAPIGGGRPAALWETRRRLRAAAAGADMVHAHGLRAGADCVAFVPDKPLAVTWHNAALGGRAWRLTHRVLARYVARSTDLTLAASEDLGDDARSSGARLVRSTFVAAPTLLRANRSTEQVRAELGVGSRPIVLALGRLQHQKRLDVLVAAAAAWREDSGGPVVLVAGEGPGRSELEAQIAATGAPVMLLGARDDVADLLEAADVVALPSEWEARALVAQEALRAGVPLVSTGVGGLSSLVGDAAIVVPVGDVGALRYAIETVLSDPQRSARMVELGLARARTWPDEARSIDELAGSYLDLMHRMRLR
jgi:glycosyltransferase involved in cell wall biosynthesis